MQACWTEVLNKKCFPTVFQHHPTTQHLPYVSCSLVLERPRAFYFKTTLQHSRKPPSQSSVVVKPFHPYDIQYCVWTALLNNFSTSEEDKDSQNKFCMVISPEYSTVRERRFSSVATTAVRLIYCQSANFSFFFFSCKAIQNAF